VAVNLRPVVEMDGAFLFALLKERPAYANISHREMPSYEEHMRFVRSDPYAAWYVIEDATGDVGAIYLTKHDEIGVFVWSSLRGQGHGSWAVAELMNIHPRPRYFANISPLNTGSQRFFQALGFELRQLTFEKASA
jgi:RimJ/RimL family protein N-acetyltransferase